MLFRDTPIQRKLMTVILMISGTVILLTCTAFFAYEFVTFRQTTVRQLFTLGQIVAANSTAALAFDGVEDANEILAALKAERHIVAASLYDEDGNLFSHYPADLPVKAFPIGPGKEGYQFEDSYLSGFQPVIQGDMRLGTLYLKCDMGAMYERFELYGVIAILVIGVCLLLAYVLSSFLQRGISTPILTLAKTAKAISEKRDYSVRANKFGEDELGLLTDAFNQMLKQIEEQNQEIISFSQNLEQKVKERTNELEIANKELEAFSYSISHDLRAPLRAIHGYMNILSEEYSTKLDAEADRLIDIVIGNAKKMGQLIDDLLAFSKLGKKELIKMHISMNDMVTDLWEELSKVEAERHIEFTLNQLPAAFADNATIKQVWTNLISNAIKYTRNKEIAIIEIGCEEKENEIIYYVKDNGAGFDMAFYNKLFGVFQRLHSYKEFEGTGVGLAIVERIISRHGGKVWAQAKLNEGATLYFSLPTGGTFVQEVTQLV